MEATYLEPPEFGVNEVGWYVLEEDRVIAGPFTTEEDAESYINDNEDNTPSSPPP